MLAIIAAFFIIFIICVFLEEIVNLIIGLFVLAMVCGFAMIMLNLCK
jgi:4-amino-4-deoxy-L-arabinose transferase-like glycosyltransferase